MKVVDALIFAAILVLFIVMCLLMSTGTLGALNSSYPYISGFVQFMLFGGSGELLSTRISHGSWRSGASELFKILLWGVGGVAVTLFFRIFGEGVYHTMEAGMLPFAGNILAYAFFTSSAHNFLFGPIHAAAMCVGSNFAEMRFGDARSARLSDAVRSVDWNGFADFNLRKMIPFFWIPVNTIVFLMPTDYRVAAAAMLSLVFGISISVLRTRRRAAA